MEIICLVGGVIIGIFLAILFLRKEPIGTLKVDNSDPDSSPYLFLEIDHGKAYMIERSKRITLRIDLSQK